MKSLLSNNTDLGYEKRQEDADIVFTNPGGREESLLWVHWDLELGLDLDFYQL